VILVEDVVNTSKMANSVVAQQSDKAATVWQAAKWWATVIGIVLLPAGIAAMVGLEYPLMRDETWHWPVLLLFGDGLPSIKVLASYCSGPGPLPYIMWGNLHAMGMGLSLLRATSLLFLSLAALGLVRVARELRAPSTLMVVAFILVQPYILTNAFLLMTDCLALALAVWSLCCILAGMKSGQSRYWALAAIAIGCLLYTRIPYLSIPVGLGLSGLMDGARRQQTLATAGICLAAVGPLIALWGGVSPLTMQGTHHMTLNLRHLNHLFAWLGFFYWPYLLTRSKWESARPVFLWALPVIATGALAAWFMPFDSYTTMAAGVVDHLVILTGDLGPGWLPHVFYFLLWGMGLCSVTHIAFQSWPIPARRTILLMAICAAALPALHPYWWERHAIPVHLFVGILAWSQSMERRWIAIAWLSLLAALAIAHLAHVLVYLG